MYKCLTQMPDHLSSVPRWPASVNRASLQVSGRRKQWVLAGLRTWRTKQGRNKRPCLNQGESKGQFLKSCFMITPQARHGTCTSALIDTYIHVISHTHTHSNNYTVKHNIKSIKTGTQSRHDRACLILALAQRQAFP